MKTIAIISQKGGAGKTTLALHLSTAAEADGLSSVLLDMDPQGTAEAWSSWRGKDEPAVLPAKSVTLSGILAKCAKHGAGLVVIDTPPLAQSEGMAAAQAADIILIPCRPAAFDLHAVRLTANLAATTRKPAFVVFNGGPPRASNTYKEASELVGQIGLNVAPERLSDRAAYRQATNTGQAAQEIEPHGKAAGEIAALWSWLKQQLSMTT